MEHETPQQPQAAPSKWKKWLKRIGVAGFLFFLIKGLVWIAILVIGVKGCS